jgi:hypothetical protein
MHHRTPNRGVVSIFGEEAKKMKKILLMCAAAGMLSSMACGKSAVKMCEENVEAYCEWDSKCNKSDKQECIKSEKEYYCDEKELEAYEKNCEDDKKSLENNKDTCSGASLESESCNSKGEQISYDCQIQPECVK